MVRCLHCVWLNVTRVHLSLHAGRRDTHHVNLVTVRFLHASAKGKVEVLGRAVERHEATRKECSLRRNIYDCRSLISSEQTWQDRHRHERLRIDIHIDGTVNLLDRAIGKFTQFKHPHVINQDADILFDRVK